MKTYTFILSILCLTAFSQTFEGSWKAKLSTGNLSLRINIHIELLEDETYTGTFDSPDQGAFDLAFSSVTLSNNALICEADRMGVKLTLEAINDNKLEGHWEQAGNAFDLQFEPLTDDTAAVSKPQDPQPPFPYIEEKTFFTNADTDTIHGTITLPNGKGPFPGVVLITGSGPQNRDSEILGHRPFLVLADYLARKGIAVFRYDERGVGESGGHFNSATSKDFAHDASFALRHFAKHKLVDNKRVGLYGHSEGGMVAGIVNTAFTQPNFIILAAAPGVPIPELLYKQSDDIMRGQGVDEETRKETLQLNETIFELIASSKELDDAIKKVNGYFEQKIRRAEKNEDTKDVETIKANQEEINLSILTPWFFYFIHFDPEWAYESIRVPTLVINGKTDLQVWWEDNTQAIKHIVNAQGYTNINVITYENLNHLFQTSESGLPLEYAANEETFNEAVMKDIAEFILAQKKGKKIGK